MATTQQYLEQLQQDKQVLVDNLIAKGVEATSDETFTSLVPKVGDIQGGSKYAPRILRFQAYSGTELDSEVSNLDTSNMTTFESMFSDCLNLENLDLSNFNTSNGYNFSYMFEGSKKFTSLDLSSFDTSSATQMAYMFLDCSVLAEVNLSSFDTTKVSTMDSMFKNCKALTELDLSNFSTPNLKRMGSTFYGCTSLKKIDMRQFDFTNVTVYGDVFKNVPAGCEVIVADDTAKEWVCSRRSDFTNVKTVAELEA